MVFLNGEEVEDSVINPKQHRFLGMMRMPYKSPPSGCLIACSCGQILHFVGEDRKHWMQGCFDIPSYITIENKKGENPLCLKPTDS